MIVCLPRNPPSGRLHDVHSDRVPHKALHLGDGEVEFDRERGADRISGEGIAAAYRHRRDGGKPRRMFSLAGLGGRTRGLTASVPVGSGNSSCATACCI